MGNPVEVASFRSAAEDAVTAATAVARIREARYVMAGPGSPSYALRQWAGTGIPDALGEKLGGGGILTMASAAALTLGVVSIPVYEIYKVGDDPTWLEGLDLLGAATGLRAAVVPHYDNAEGGTHDTRFCYMGERRLRTLEAMLPDGAFVLGVDSHTALVLDLETGEASIAGLGGVTVRVDGRSTRFGAGTTLPIEALGEAARALAAGDATDAVHDAALAGGPAEARTTAAPPLRDAMADLEGTFVAALDHGETREAVAALLDLDSAIVARLRQGEDSPDLDSASAMFRSLIVRLGDGAAASAATRRDRRAGRRPRGGARHGPREPRLRDRGPDPGPPRRGRDRGARRRERIQLGARGRGGRGGRDRTRGRRELNANGTRMVRACTTTSGPSG